MIGWEITELINRLDPYGDIRLNSSYHHCDSADHLPKMDLDDDDRGDSRQDENWSDDGNEFDDDNDEVNDDNDGNSDNVNAAPAAAEDDGDDDNDDAGVDDEIIDDDDDDEETDDVVDDDDNVDDEFNYDVDKENGQAFEMHEPLLTCQRTVEPMKPQTHT